MHHRVNMDHTRYISHARTIPHITEFQQTRLLLFDIFILSLQI